MHLKSGGLKAWFYADSGDFPGVGSPIILNKNRFIWQKNEPVFCFLGLEIISQPSLVGFCPVKKICRHMYSQRRGGTINYNYYISPKLFYELLYIMMGWRMLI